MKLQSLSDLERSIGGRPKQSFKRKRITVYLPEEDIIKLKSKAEANNTTVSEMMRQQANLLLRS